MVWVLINHREKYATLDIYGKWYLMAIVSSANVARGEWAGLCTQANESQLTVSIQLRMTLSLHAPSICKDKVTNYVFNGCRRPNHLKKCVWNFNLHSVQRPTRPTLSTVADAPAAQSIICHCYPEWHNIPVYQHSKFPIIQMTTQMNRKVYTICPLFSYRLNLQWYRYRWVQLCASKHLIWPWHRV